MSSLDVAPPAEPYIWKLPEEAKSVALDELREDDTVREQSLQQMREWIQKHPNIKKCRTDAPFLLRFLRTKKFSLPQACALLERYLTVRQLYPNWFRNLDANDPIVDEIISAGYLIPFAGRDSKNRQVFMTNIGKFDPHKYTPEQMSKTHAIIVETYLDDELNQVYGYTYVNDETGLSMAHLSMWSLTEIKTMINCIQNTTPARHKETHFINFPSIGAKLLEFIKGLLSEKLKNRIILHKSQDDLKEAFDPAILPKEYGGVVPVAQLIETMKAKIREKREELLALDEMCIDVDSNVNLEGDMKDELGTGLIGSFRKLEVD